MPYDLNTQRALRRNICRQCAERPAGSERWDDDATRPCQTACQVFVFSQPLVELADKSAVEQVQGSEHVMSLPLACGACNLQDESGHCAAAGNGTCPLCRYSDKVMTVLRGASQSS